MNHSPCLQTNEFNCGSAVGIYSGAGGYSAYRPGLVGLTPGQFREMRKDEEDEKFQYEQQEFLISYSSDV